jgi:hypothetical protein
MCPVQTVTYVSGRSQKLVLTAARRGFIDRHASIHFGLRGSACVPGVFARRAADEAMALEGAHIEPRFGAPIVNPPDDLDCDDRPGVSSRTIRDID